MDIGKNPQASSGNNDPSQKKLAKQILLVIFLFLLFFAIVFRAPLINKSLRVEAYFYSHIQDWAKSHGFIAQSYYTGADPSLTEFRHAFFKALLSAPRHWWQGDSSTLPVFRFDITPENMQKLEAIREAALKRGVLIKSKTESDFVDAALTVDNKTYKVSVRLKGDLFNHFMSDKWSFRVKLHGNKSILGLRRFSIESPITRGCLDYKLIQKTLQATGQSILAPQFIYVREFLNNKDLGVMGIEEHMTKELLVSQQRLNSIIIKFDEDHLWPNLDAQAGHNIIYDNFLNDAIVPFDDNALDESQYLRRDYYLAVGLLRGFLYGKLPATAVFDVNKVGAYLSVSDLFGAPHGLRWNNTRYYYNPTTAKLEPIQFDNKTFMHLPPGKLATEFEFNFAPVLSRILLKDPAILQAYYKTSAILAKKIADHSLQTELQTTEQQYLKQIGSDFYLYPEVNFDFMQQQIHCLLPDNHCSSFHYTSFDKTIELISLKDALQDQVLQAFNEKDLKSSQLELMNILPVPQQIQMIKAYAPDGSEVPLNFTNNVHLPLMINAAEIGKLPVSIILPYEAKSAKNIANITVTSQPILSEKLISILGNAKPMTINARRYSPPFDHALFLKLI
jgi:hypothetical protein